MSWIDDERELLKTAMNATAVHVDLLGITLTIDGRALFIPKAAIDAMPSLIRDAEAAVVRDERRRQQKERGPY